MTFLQQGAADTLNFMLLGMGVILGIMLLYVVNLVLRLRSARNELELLQSIDAESEDSEPTGSDADTNVV